MLPLKLRRMRLKSRQGGRAGRSGRGPRKGAPAPAGSGRVGVHFQGSLTWLARTCREFRRFRRVSPGAIRCRASPAGASCCGPSTRRTPPASCRSSATREVVRYWSRPPLADLEAAGTFLDEMQEDFFRRRSFHWGIAEARSEPSRAGPLIGTCMLGALSFRHRRAEVGFVLRRDRWGQGLAADALAVLFGFCFGRLAPPPPGGGRRSGERALAAAAGKAGFSARGAPARALADAGRCPRRNLPGIAAARLAQSP